MRILITNDDGIDAPGLAVLKKTASRLAGPGGDVWTVAPATEQSGTGHCVSFVRPFLISKISEREFAVEGTPADCVLAGLYDIMPPHRPDFVLSGINRGNNSGENALYSGTVGAALEASLHGLTGIALSQYFGPDNRGLDNPFGAAEEFAADAVRVILRSLETAGNDYPLFFNVNFPPCPAAEVAGMRAAAQGMRPDAGFRVVPAVSPAKRRFLWVHSGSQNIPGRTGTDITVNLERFISITPMRADMTAHEAMDKLNGQLSCPR